MGESDTSAAQTAPQSSNKQRRFGLLGMFRGRRSQAAAAAVESGRNRFFSAVARVKESPHYMPVTDHKAPYGYFDGRHVIGEENDINGGVYLGLIPHEALVVDEKFGMLDNLYQKLARQLTLQKDLHGNTEAGTVQVIFNFVREHLRLNPKAVRDLAFEIGIGPDRKAALDHYIKRRVAAPRHQVILAAYLIQRAKQSGTLSGTPRILPDHGDLPAEDEKLTYRCGDGAELLFDPLST